MRNPEIVTANQKDPAIAERAQLTDAPGNPVQRHVGCQNADGLPVNAYRTADGSDEDVVALKGVAVGRGYQRAVLTDRALIPFFHPRIRAHVQKFQPGPALGIVEEIGNEPTGLIAIGVADIQIILAAKRVRFERQRHSDQFRAGAQHLHRHFAQCVAAGYAVADRAFDRRHPGVDDHGHCIQLLRDGRGVFAQ